MFRFIAFASCFVALAFAGINEERIATNELETQASHFGQVSIGLSAHGSSKTYATGAELTSLAHTSAIQAKTAVRNQNTAGVQAAFGAASGLAQAALGAAATAQAALVGKQAIVHGLERQLQDAEHQLQAEISQFHQTEQAAVAAQQAAQQAQQQVSALSAVAAIAQGAAQQGASAASQAAQASASQHAMVQEAKQKVSHLRDELHQAVAGLQETEISAQKAAVSAQVAQSNAAAAATAVASSAANSEIDAHNHIDHY